MNIQNGLTFDCYGEDPLIDVIAEALGDDAGINIDQNCSIDEMGTLLVEVANHFAGDTVSALAAIRSGELQFEEIHYPEGNYWAWHIKAKRQ